MFDKSILLRHLTPSILLHMISFCNIFQGRYNAAEFLKSNLEFADKINTAVQNAVLSLDENDESLDSDESTSNSEALIQTEFE